MRWLFDAVYLALLPWGLPYWLWKLPQGRRYRAGLLHRLGLAPRLGPGRRLWVHCASVGEAAVPRRLVERFRSAHPHWDVVFSAQTDTGADRLRELYPTSTVFYWPLDLSVCVDASLRRVNPSAVVLVELELWPGFLLACRARGIPVVVVNGRMNASSAALMRGLSRLCPGLWAAVRLCCARSEADAARFAEAGLPRERIVTTGSLKYDALETTVDRGRAEGLRRRFALAPDAPVLVGGSTHPGEEQMLCRLYRKLRARHGGLRLVLVPRHVERADAVARETARMGLSVVRKSALDSGRARATGEEVILVDTVGDLVTCYGLAACVFVGRSMLPPGGGQNMMEPAALGKPVVVGPHTRNFEPEMETLLGRRAVVVVRDEEELLAAVDAVLADPFEAAALGARARRVAMESRGAAERTLERLEAVLCLSDPPVGRARLHPHA